MSELKPCPFCGSKSRQIWVSTFTEEKMTGCSNSDCEYFRNEYPVDWWQSRPIEDELRAELARRDEIIKRLKEDADRLAKYCQHIPMPDTTCWMSSSGAWNCKCGATEAFENHRQLMKEL